MSYKCVAYTSYQMCIYQVYLIILHCVKEVADFTQEAMGMPCEKPSASDAVGTCKSLSLMLKALHHWAPSTSKNTFSLYSFLWLLNPSFMRHAWLTLCEKSGDPSIKIKQKVHWLGIADLLYNMCLPSALEYTD